MHISQKNYIRLLVCLTLVFSAVIAVINLLPLTRHGVFYDYRSVPESEILMGNDDPNSVRSELLPGTLVNINTADKATLMLLPGIGDSTAEAIISYRNENGSFSSAEDLLALSGIGESELDALRGLITVSSEVG